MTAIQDAARSGGPVSVSAIARAGSVDRSFLYRHPDLLAQVHAAQAAPAAGTSGTAAVSHAALQADLANALDRSHRLAARVRQLETRLSQLLGEKAWHAPGLGAPADIDELQRQVNRPPFYHSERSVASTLTARTLRPRAGSARSRAPHPNHRKLSS